MLSHHSFSLLSDTKQHSSSLFFARTARRGRNYHIKVMPTSLPSIPWATMFRILIPMTALIVQMGFNNSSPLDEHPESVWICIIALLVCCCALEYHGRLQSHFPTATTFMKLCVQLTFASGSLVYAALISLLLPRCLELLVFIGWFLVLSIYFNHEKIARICGNLIPYISGLWRRIASSLYELWGITQNGNFAANNQPPV